MPKRKHLTANGMIRASVTTAGHMLARVYRTAYGKTLDFDSGALTSSDVTILRFLAAIELIESDLWQQYDEMGGVTEGPQNPYQLALQFLDGDGSRCITENAVDEVSHSTYLNAFLESEGADPVNFDRFRSLPGSLSKVAQDTGRLTNLMHLSMDTSWLFHAHQMEDSKAEPPRVIRIINRQAIPQTDADFGNAARIQEIANTAALHFGYVEHLVSSLYATFSNKVQRAKVLKVALGIGGNEIAHLLGWMDSGHRLLWAPFQSDSALAQMTEGRSPSSDTATAPARSPSTSLNFPIPPSPTSELLTGWTALLPVEARYGGAVDTINLFSQNGIFVGQSPEFLWTLLQMAEDADSALDT